MEDEDKHWLPSPEEVDEYFEKTKNSRVTSKQSVREWLQEYQGGNND